MTTATTTATGFEDVDIFPFVDGDDDKIQAARLRARQKEEAWETMRRQAQVWADFAEAAKAPEIVALWEAFAEGAEPDADGDYRLHAGEAINMGHELEKQLGCPREGHLPLAYWPKFVGHLKEMARLSQTPDATRGGYGIERERVSRIQGPKALLRAMRIMDRLRADGHDVSIW